MKVYEVNVFIDGEPTYIVDVPTYQGLDAALRRAKFAIAAQHGSMDLDRITTELGSVKDEA
jgi:hypothetical protein